MSVAERSIDRALAEVVGRDALRRDDATCARFAVDGIVPRWVVRPAALEQVSALLALAHDAGLAVAPRGAGTSLELGHPAARLDVVLDLGALDRIVEYNPDDLTISVEAGARLGALTSRLAERRQFLALDPAHAAVRTLGGVVATGASGPLRVRYGTPRDLLLGVRFVQADGVVTWGGARVVKSVSGYDVPKLMVGALGTLGVLTELTLRLHPMPEVERAWLIPWRDAEAAQEFVLRLADSAIQPSRVELLNGTAAAACGEVAGPLAVVVSIGTAAAAVLAQGDTLGRVARAAGSMARPVAAGFWARYDAGLPAEGPVWLGVTTLASRLAEVLAEVETAASAVSGSRVALTGAAPLGLLRLVLASADPAAVRALVERLRERVAPDGGGVTIRRAPREVRAAVDPWGPIEPAAFALMRAIKDEFDPERVLNPGRFVGGL